MTTSSDLHFGGTLSGDDARAERALIARAIAAVDAENGSAARAPEQAPLRHDWIVDARAVSDRRTVYIAHAAETDFAVSGPTAEVLGDRIRDLFEAQAGSRRSEAA
jgi:hypothetical protein